MNIVKLQNQLKSVPVETLIQYVQGANPEVPSYLALAEIKNRKDMEARYASQNQQAPEKSVAEDLTQAPDQSGLAMLAKNPTPQGAPTSQGVADLPVPDTMFSGKGMAAGGIVAFDDGGDVASADATPGSEATARDAYMSDIQRSLMGSSPVHYTGATTGPAIASSSPYGTDMIGEMMRVSPEVFRYDYGVGRGTSPYAGAAYGSIRRDLGYANGGVVKFNGLTGSDVASKKYQAWQEDAVGPGYLWAGAKDVLGAPFQYAWTTDPVTGKLVRKKDLEGMTPSLDAYNKAAQLRKQGLIAEAENIEKAAASPQVSRKGLASIDTSTAEPGMTFSRDELANIYQNTTPTRTKPIVNPNAPAAEAAPANVDVTKPATLGTPGIDSLLEDTTGLAEKKMARYEQMMGTNPERARLEELVKKYETGAGEQERMAPWMALAKAGFTMAGGKSPYAIQNLSEGAVAGLADYAQAKDRLDKLNERQIDLRSKLLQVDDARKSAAVTYGVNSEEHASTRNAQVKLKDLEEQNANLRADAQNKTHIKAAQIAAAKKSDYETYLELAKKDDDNYKFVKDKDGNMQKVFNANKVTQAFKSWSGSSGFDEDKMAAEWQQLRMVDKAFKAKYPTSADYILAVKSKLAGGTTPETPAANRPPLNTIFKK